MYQNLGEMSELAEGARLEIVCAAKSGTEGSNPSLSARKINSIDFHLWPIAFGLWHMEGIDFHLWPIAIGSWHKEGVDFHW